MELERVRRSVSQVLCLLRRYLGEYVHGLSAEALRISVWKGDVLKDLNLKVKALNSLKLPVTVKDGFVGTITLKVLMLFLAADCLCLIFSEHSLYHVLYT